MSEWDFIDTPKQLIEALSSIGQAPWFGIDTEFVRVRHYFPTPCLMQVAVPNQIFLFDLTALENTSALGEVLSNSDAPKILHAGQQDLEIFVQLWGKIPTPLFDTQVAAAMTGHATQIGYSDLVRNALHTETVASLGRYDWSQRPIEHTAIAYAVDDVRYLGELKTQLEAQLNKLHRLNWFHSEMARLANPERYRPDPTAAWRRIRAANRFHGQAKTNLKVLAQWREQKAIAEDLPRQWVLRDEVLIKLAQKPPARQDDLATSKYLDRRFIKRFGQELIEYLNTIGSVKIEQSKPPASGNQHPDQTLIDLLMVAVKIRAKELSLSPSRLATRRQLGELISHPDTCQLLQEGNREQIGLWLRRLLSGQMALTAKGNSLAIVSLAKTPPSEPASLGGRQESEQGKKPKSESGDSRQ